MSSARSIYSIDSNVVANTSDEMRNVARGVTTGKSVFRLIGMSNTQLAAENLLWPIGGTAYIFPTSPMQMSVVSSVTTDTSPSGTGALTVQITYLDGSYVEKTETVTMNGTTPVLTVATDIFRVQKIKVLTAGTNKYNNGAISISHISDGTVYDSMIAKRSVSTSAKITVPLGKTVYLTSADYSERAASYKSSFIVTATEGESGIFYPLASACEFNAHSQSIFNPPLKIVAKSDIAVNAFSTSTNDPVSVVLHGWIE